MPDRTISDLWRTLRSFFRSAGGFEGKEITTPSNPASGYRRIYPKTDGWYELNSSGSECRISDGKALINQASHGFTVGKPLYDTGSALALAQADTAAHAEMVGVVHTVIDTDNFVIAFPGTVVAGLSSLTRGAVYFLDASTAGAVAPTAPAIDKPVYIALSTTTAVVQGMRGLTAEATNPDTNVVDGRLTYVDTTTIKYAFVNSNQIRVWNNTDEIEATVECSSEVEFTSTSDDMNGDDMTYATVYDVFAKYESATSVSLQVAKWAVSTAGSSARTAAWVTSTVYKIGQRVSNSGSYYPCLEAHTSGTFATDLAAGKWGPAMTGTGDFLGLDIGDGGYPLYSNTGEWRSYRWLGVIFSYNDTGSKFRNTDYCSSIGNYYNRQPRKHKCYNTNANWTLGTQIAWQEYNNGTGQVRANFLSAVTQEASCFYIEKLAVSAGVTGYTGTSLDGIDPDSPGGVWIAWAITGVNQKVFSVNSVSLGPGYHYATEVQSSSGTNTTYYSNNPSGMFAAWVVEV